MVVAFPCPPWDYQDFNNYQDILRNEARLLVRDLRAGRFSVEDEGVDGRPIHERLFIQLTPPLHPYFAGHYRGENFPCLVDYTVHIPGDPMVGLFYGAVQAEMAALGDKLLMAVGLLDHSFALAAVSQQEKLYQAVVIAARAFQELLTIHPYANGNGHMARFLVWLLLGRYRYWPSAWTIDPRPNASNYGDVIARHRRGEPDPLEVLILQSVL